MRLPVAVPAVTFLLAACGSGGGGPMFADDHPRSYLSRNLDRLRTALEEGRPAAVRFKEIVDLEMQGADIYDFQAWFAALAGKLTDDPAYCDYAVGLVDAFVSEEEARIDRGENPQVAFDSYLEVGPRLGDVMLTYDWCFETASSSQKTRWLDFAAETVRNIWDPEGASWGGRSAPWSGWSIDNPSNNYYYSFLRATMLFGLVAHGEHPDAEGWLDFFRDQKIDAQLVPTFEAQLQGGGSREGTGYGVAMMRLWELYDLWQGSTGEDLAGLTSHTRSSMLWMMHAVVPTRDRLAPIGDHARDSTAALFDYHRHYLQTLAYLHPDDGRAGQVKTFLDSSTVPEMGEPFMYVYDFLYESDVEPAPMDEMGRAYFGPGTGQLFARSSWDTDATFVSFIAGPYSESHAHHDQGSLMIYQDGWQAYDPIVESASGIRGEEELHNLVRIVAGGETVPQREGTASELTALARGDGWLHAAGDLTPAYAGAGAVENVERELVFVEPDVVVVFDRVETAGGTTQVWQLNAPVAPSLGDGTAAIGDLDVVRLAPASAEASVFDWSNDGDLTGGYRLDEEVGGGAVAWLHVLSVDGAVSSAVRDDAGGRIGAAIELADGRSVSVAFSEDGVDGTLVIRDGGGGVVVDEALGAGVDSLPE